MLHRIEMSLSMCLNALLKSEPKCLLCFFLYIYSDGRNGFWNLVFRVSYSLEINKSVVTKSKLSCPPEIWRTPYGYQHKIYFLISFPCDSKYLVLTEAISNPSATACNPFRIISESAKISQSIFSLPNAQGLYYPWSGYGFRRVFLFFLKIKSLEAEVGLEVGGVVL